MIFPDSSIEINIHNYLSSFALVMLLLVADETLEFKEFSSAEIFPL